jgi:nicotinamidase/pyrazinamidase
LKEEKNMPKIDLLCIDPQWDFCSPTGALPVPGADGDCDRLAAMITRISDRLNDIHVTLDTHHWFDIAHPSFWVSGKDHKTHPNPFTLITEDDLKNDVWKTTVPAYQNRRTMVAHGIERDGAEEYVHQLTIADRYKLCIWPPHCLIGSPGANVMPVVWEALNKWERDHESAFVDYVTKGSNYWTEHYSAVMADVPDPEDPSTQLNTKLISTLQEVDLIGISGQALSHCVANTIRDIANNFGEENIKKFVLIEDTSSNVAGFEQLGIDFVKEMTKRGMQISKAADFMK